MLSWADLRYGTVFRSTPEGSDRSLTLFFVNVVEAADHISALLIDCDRESPSWRLGAMSKIEIVDFWRFEVVE